MRRILYLLVMLLIFVNSCSEDDLTVLSNRIALKELIIENNQIKLEWNRPHIKNFDFYRIYRTTEPITNFDNYYYNGSIAQITDIDETVYYDNLTLEENVYYTIVATSSTSEPIISNCQKLENSDQVIFDDSPYDVVFYPEGNKLFLFMGTKIYSVDYELMEIADSIVLSSDENYGSLGNFNNKDELYVSCSNGYLRIFDVNTLIETANIYIGGNIKSTVCDDNNILYIKTYENWDGNLYSYNRSTLNQIDKYSGWYDYNGRIKHLKNSNRIIEITSSISPDDLIYYDHDDNGFFMTANNDNYHSDHPLNHEIFECFPEGNFFITDKAGAIYNQNLGYVNQLGGSYSLYEHFCIDDFIYAASSEKKEIWKFSKMYHTSVQNYPTLYYPKFIYKDGNQLIIIGYDYYDSYSSSYGNIKYTIEKINLN